jgi:hypothetical protein
MYVCSTLTEMRSLFAVVKDIVFLIGLSEKLGFTVIKPVNVYKDNKTCVILSNQKFGSNKKVRHFIMLVEYCRQQVYLGKMKISHIDTEENIPNTN